MKRTRNKKYRGKSKRFNPWGTRRNQTQIAFTISLLILLYALKQYGVLESVIINIHELWQSFSIYIQGLVLSFSK